MEARFCVEVVTGSTCSLLSLIGLQLALLLREGGLVLPPAGFTVSGNSTRIAPSSTPRPTWLVASTVNLARQGKRKVPASLVYFIKGAQFYVRKFGETWGRQLIET